MRTSSLVFKILAVTALVLALASGSAQATLVLRIEDPTGTIDVTVRDNEAGDTSPVAGTIQWGSFDPATLLTSITAIRDNDSPELGISTPNLYINVAFLRSSLPPGLTVELTDTGFVSDSPTGFVTAVGNDFNGKGINFRNYWDPSNQEFGQSGNIGTISIAQSPPPRAINPFNETTSGFVNLPSEGSLTMLITTNDLSPLPSPPYFMAFQTFITFEPAPEADPVTIGGTVTDLQGSGLVLQNNGSDNLPIAGDGPFTFDTPLTPGTFYNVTVATNPTNPSQICSVEGGGGQVPDEAVTDVAVSCAEPILSDVSKVAAEGDPRDDDTILSEILLEGGVAISIGGDVAFHVRDDNSTDAVFTQFGLVRKEGDTLPDDTIVERISAWGEVASSAGQVAFHGQDGELKAAVFTQDKLVAKEGGTLPGDETVVDRINDRGKVASNNLGEVAFHGQIEVDDDVKVRAVFTSARLVAQEGDTLPDDTFLEVINDSGGVAINDFDQVAFHGLTDGLETAVFTSDALGVVAVVAKAGDILPPDDTILDEINASGGVAINLFGDVAFHGRTPVDAVFIDAVFIQYGSTQDALVVKVGDTLPDGTTLDEISVSGGVAINLLGEVAFHGKTGGRKAVFTQNGLVAKEGDNLIDGITLDQISDSAGVAINLFGDVAFHGRIGSNDAVFVGMAP